MCSVPFLSHGEYNLGQSRIPNKLSFVDDTVVVVVLLLVALPRILWVVSDKGSIARNGDNAGYAFYY